MTTASGDTTHAAQYHCQTSYNYCTS